MTRQTFGALSPTRTLAPSVTVPAAARGFPTIPTQTLSLPHLFHSVLPHYSFAMPPRKKAKASAASTPLRDTQPKTPQDSGAAQSQDELLNNPWADEQETQLYKSMMKWKPTGSRLMSH
jgi:hypothetical protein